MRIYHIEVIRDDDWFVGRVMDRPGVTTQGRTLDELVLMLRDAVALMWGEKNVHLELSIGPKVATGKRTTSPGTKRAVAMRRG